MRISDFGFRISDVKPRPRCVPSQLPDPKSQIRRRAFTLVEAITTLVILAVISGAASRVLFQAFGALNDANTRYDLHVQVSNSMERICDELRTIRIDTATATATPDITACTATSISFNNTSGAARTISLSGSNLVITGDAAATQTMASGVTTFTIQTYDKSNTALPASPSAAQIDTIRRIQITITVTNGSVSETLRTKIFLRCMAAGSGST